MQPYFRARSKRKKKHRKMRRDKLSSHCHGSSEMETVDGHEGNIKITNYFALERVKRSIIDKILLFCCDVPSFRLDCVRSILVLESTLELKEGNMVISYPI